ncbi:disease resistance RPP13 protein [Salix suchowensis]|nr:disease resistance RPP13 protein [Salix suchowensis]
MYWWFWKGFHVGLEIPEIKKRILVGFRMHSLIRYAVIFVAERVGFFHFDSMGNPTENFSTSQRACLIKPGEKYSRQVLPDLESKPETLHALFNVNDPYPDLNTEWFSRMRNINVLCLGRWGNSYKKNNEAEETKHDVEVENTESLKGLRSMKHLKFLSPQGISRINELPETIQNLTIPENMVSLQKLTHLDISDCYMLDFMPKGLGSVTELQVLKGFVISNLKIKNAGTLDDLKGLPKLRKLSIYTAKKDLLDDSRKLKRINGFRQESNAAVIPYLPEHLVKLDLQCYPETKAPIWLSPGSLENLQKLHIRGGHLSALGRTHDGNDKWNVKIPRLNFLKN